MEAIDYLLQQVSDPVLRGRLEDEIERLSKNKKFGLVFEEHIPECTPLYGIGIRTGSAVARKAGQIKDVYVVLQLNEGTAKCYNKVTKETVDIPVDDLVVVAQFGEPIFPMLQPIDSIQNAPDSSLWHTLIEADNYHALQLLEYLYTGKVDCIYIDPPYNTGARDWKYNNDYVDGADAYRHSKWLSMMEKRLRIAKRLLNPNDSVLLVTIDEKEYLHLGCLLEEMFPKARMQMISTLTNSRGVARENGFARVDEYIFVLQFGNSSVCRLPLSDEWRVNIRADKRVTHLRWSMLIRSGSHFLRRDSVNQFYPIYVYNDGSKIHSVGEPYYGDDRNEIIPPEGTFAVWPLRKDGNEGNWQISAENLRGLIKEGYVMLGRKANGTVPVYYLKKGEIAKVKNGVYQISGHREDGSIISDTEVRSLVTGTQWRIGSHDASVGGTALLKSMFGNSRFTYPKSLYAERDTIRFFVANKPNALVVDFFAGSGTTLHAVNLLNAEDGGSRRCILVTNNEVSEEESKALRKKGYQPGDPEWENLGVARHVTWPRTICSIKGRNIKGEPLKGTYAETEIPIEDGFKANCEYFKLGFMDKDNVSLGRQFREILPLLWLKAGAIGKRPEIDEDEPDMLILPENGFAVLVDETCFARFLRELKKTNGIKHVFLVTDSDDAFREMSTEIPGREAHQLYREYIDNFVLGNRRA